MLCFWSTFPSHLFHIYLQIYLLLGHFWFAILLFGAWVTSRYLRVKPKTLTRVPVVTSLSLLILHLLSVSQAQPLGHPPWTQPIPPLCLLQVALGLHGILASSAGHGGGWLGSPAGKYLGLSSDAALYDGKARGFEFTHIFINSFNNFCWIPGIGNIINNQAQGYSYNSEEVAQKWRVTFWWDSSGCSVHWALWMCRKELRRLSWRKGCVRWRKYNIWRFRGKR